MSKLSDKLKDRIGYDEIKSKKDLMKEAKFNYNRLFLGIGYGLVGLILMVSRTPYVWLSIILKIVGFILILNGIGYILGSFYFEDKMQDVLESKTDNTFFHKDKKK